MSWYFIGAVITGSLMLFSMLGGFYPMISGAESLFLGLILMLITAGIGHWDMQRDIRKDCERRQKEYDRIQTTLPEYGVE